MPGLPGLIRGFNKYVMWHNTSSISRLSNYGVFGIEISPAAE